MFLCYFSIWHGKNIYISLIMGVMKMYIRKSRPDQPKQIHASFLWVAIEKIITLTQHVAPILCFSLHPTSCFVAHDWHLVTIEAWCDEEAEVKLLLLLSNSKPPKWSKNLIPLTETVAGTIFPSWATECQKVKSEILCHWMVEEWMDRCFPNHPGSSNLNYGHVSISVDLI